MILACIKPLAVLLLPFAFAWAITRYSPIEARRSLMVAAFGMAAVVACVSIAPAAMVVAVVAGQVMETVWNVEGPVPVMIMTVDGRATSSSVASIYTKQQVNQAALHGLSGFEGVDVVGMGDPNIYAPFDGYVDSVGCDGLPSTTYLKQHPICGTQATWLDMRSADNQYRMVLLHGDYTVQAGDKIRQGQRIGTDNCWGNCTGNHSHVMLWDRGVLVSYLDYAGKPAEATPDHNLAGLVQALVALGYSPSSDVGLRISHYEPAAGGINCDHDCGHMASGDVTWDWTGGKNGIYAAACPPAWPFGTRFQLAGATYECRDRGGWIQCYAPGETDKATGSAATESYCWVDLYNTPPVGYGTLVYDWKFVN